MSAKAAATTINNLSMFIIRNYLLMMMMMMMMMMMCVCVCVCVFLSTIKASPD